MRIFTQIYLGTSVLIFKYQAVIKIIIFGVGTNGQKKHFFQYLSAGEETSPLPLRERDGGRDLIENYLTIYLIIL